LPDARRNPAAAEAVETVKGVQVAPNRKNLLVVERGNNIAVCTR